MGFIPFPRVLVLCEMQSVLSRNWTRIAVSISCDNNHYTTGTSICRDANVHNECSLYMTQKCIWWWGSTPGALGNVEYFFIANISKSTQTQNGSLIWLVYFYGTSTIVGYLLLNPFLYIWTILFQTIQFSISKVFYLQTVKCQNSSISNSSV